MQIVADRVGHSAILGVMQEGPGPRPFDVSLKYLIELDARGWLDWLRLPPDGPVESIASDVGTVLAEVDKVLRIDGSDPWLAHIEVQASLDDRLESRLLQYHALLHHRHGLPVETTVVLLRPEAEGPRLSGRYQRRGRFGNLTFSFEYRVVRLWERPLQELLDGGLGVLPLAPLANVEPMDMPPVIKRLDERLSDEADPTTADEIWQTILLLLRLRYDEDEVHTMVLPSEVFRETRLYQLLREDARRDVEAEAHAKGLAEGHAKGRAEGQAEGRAEGRAEGQVGEARRVLLALGTERLGTPDATTLSTLDDLIDVEALERLLRRVLTASSWQELLEGQDKA